MYFKTPPSVQVYSNTPPSVQMYFKTPSVQVYSNTPSVQIYPNTPPSIQVYSNTPVQVYSNTPSVQVYSNTPPPIQVYSKTPPVQMYSNTPPSIQMYLSFLKRNNGRCTYGPHTHSMLTVVNCWSFTLSQQVWCSVGVYRRKRHWTQWLPPPLTVCTAAAGQGVGRTETCTRWPG